MGQFNPIPVDDFIGKGIAYPIELVNGKPKAATGKELIVASVRAILEWSLGTRFYLGEFGNRLKDLLEEPNDEVVNDLLEAFIKESLLKWEKRIIVISVSVNQTENNKSVLIAYSIKGLTGIETFIWPFYNEIIY